MEGKSPGVQNKERIKIRVIGVNWNWVCLESVCVCVFLCVLVCFMCSSWGWVGTLDLSNTLHKGKTLNKTILTAKGNVREDCWSLAWTLVWEQKSLREDSSWCYPCIGLKFTFPSGTSTSGQNNWYESEPVMPFSLGCLTEGNGTSWEGQMCKCHR